MHLLDLVNIASWVEGSANVLRCQTVSTTHVMVHAKHGNYWPMVPRLPMHQVDLHPDPVAQRERIRQDNADECIAVLNTKQSKETPASAGKGRSKPGGRHARNPGPARGHRQGG